MARIDKWLWAARFYKTRSLASDAVKSGQVRVNGSRVKPAKTLQGDEEIAVNKGQGHEITVRVMDLSEKRQSFAIASQLYEETAESIEKRALRKTALESGLIDTQSPKKKPDKRQRRLLSAIKQNELKP